MRIAYVSPKWNAMVNSYPPLGLGYLAAVAERAGHEVRIYDLGLDPNVPLEQDMDRIAAFDPELIGVTAMTNNYHAAEAMIAQLKARIGCPVILGGPHATLFPEDLAADPNIDYVVVGEGEETQSELVELLQRTEMEPDGEQLSAIQGLCYFGDYGVVRTAPRPLIKDLDALPLPARHLYELDRYPLYAPNGERMVTILASRGCPYNCSYCFKGIVGRTYRQRSAESVLAEIVSLIDAYGYRNFYFIDDLFTQSPRFLRAITTQIIEAGLDIRWECLARVDRVTPELLELMYRSGCRELHFGIETGNPDILESLGKGITMEQVRKAVRWTSDVGIMAKGYFMLGLPNDTDETMQQTIQFASELELDEAMFSLTTPFPGTRLWDELVERRPDLEYNRDFSKAFYYTNYDQMITPFFNVSEVSDERLSQLAFEAQARFQEAKRRRKYLTAFGPRVGERLYRISQIGWVRQIGFKLLRSRLYKAIKGRGAAGAFGEIGEYNQREVYAKSWK